MATTRSLFRSILLLAGLAVGPVSITGVHAADTTDMRSLQWHQFRGPDATGVSPSGDPPTTWSESENVQWKIPIPGRGSSTPIVWGDKIFLVTAINSKKIAANLPAPEDQPKRPFGITYPNTVHQYIVLCLDRQNGKELWRRVAAERVPNEGHHGDNSFASSSPTTDGKRLYVWFGSAGLHCFDLDGTPLWSRNFGEAKTRLSFGEAASPVIHGDKVIVTRDQEDQSYIVVVNANTGETVWRADRDEPSGWSTPIVVRHGDRDQLITNGKVRVRSYDLADGSLIWECGGQASNVTPSPVQFEETVLCMSGYRGSALYALPLNASGDITDSDSISWSKDRSTPYVPSPLLYGRLLYYTQSNNGILSVVDAGSGDVVIDRHRLPDVRRLYASPVGAAGRVYIAGRDGATLVIKRSDQFELLASNKLDEGTDASPAIVGNQLFIRGKSHLYCIADARKIAP